MSVTDWSAAPDANATADPTIPALDGTSARKVPELVRSVMAKVAAFSADQGGALVTEGTDNAYVVATASGYAKVRAGVRLAVRPDRDNTDAATLNVDGSGPKAWLDAGGGVLAAGRIKRGRLVTVSFSETRNAWLSDAGIALGNADLQAVPPATLKGNASTDTGAPTDLAPSTVRTLLGVDRVPNKTEAEIATAGAVADAIGLVRERVVKLEQDVGTPDSVTFATRAAAIAATSISPTTTVVVLLGYLQPGDGGGGRYEYSASPPPGAEAITIDGRTFVLAEVSPSILQFGGFDDGATNLVPILDRVRATYPGTEAITLRFPFRGQGTYFLASPADFTRILVDPADGIRFSATIQPPSVFRTLAPVFFYFRSLKYGYVISPEVLKKAPIQKRAYVRRADVLRRRSRIIDPTGADLTHAYLDDGSDTWIGGIIPTARNASGVQWQTSADSRLYGSFVPAVPGEELHCCFPSGENFLRTIIVRCVAGYQAIYIRQDGSAVFRTKPVAGSVSEAPVTWQAMATMPVYNGALGDLTVCVINQRRWTLRVSGVDVLNGVEGLGPIEWVGYGTFGTGGIVAPISGWNRYRGGDVAGTQSQKLLVVGDSRSEALAGSWPDEAMEILDRSLGMRWTDLINLAIGGHTSAQQLARLQTSGTGGATVATIGLGTNDIQQGVPVGAVGTSGSYIDNLSQIFAYLRARAVKPVFVLPMVWYEQGHVLQAVGEIRGQGAQNSGGGAIYRQAAIRLCNALGIPVVDTLQGHGIVDVGFLNRDAFDLDPTLRDNIHQTGAAYADQAVWIAEAIASLVVPNITRAILPEPLSSSYLRAGWGLPAELYLPWYSRSEGGVVHYSGLLSAGTKAGGTVIMQSPRFLWPSRTMNFPVLQVSAASRDVGRLQIGNDGQWTLYMTDTSAGLISLDGISHPTD